MSLNRKCAWCKSIVVMTGVTIGRNTFFSKFFFVIINVAIGAIAWSSLEYAVDVAGLAARVGMDAGELKAGLEMVKTAARDLRHRGHKTQGQRQRHEPADQAVCGPET